MRQAVEGLHAGLCDLSLDDIEFVFSIYEGQTNLPVPGCRQVEIGRHPNTSARGRLKRRLPFLESVVRRVPQVPGVAPGLDRSDGTLESMGVALVHLATQAGFLTEIPSIYQPHDLQHVHYPEFFSPRTIAWRDRAFRAYCEQARFVVVMTRWGKEDLLGWLPLDEDKVRIVPHASSLSLTATPDEAEITRVVQRYRVPETFFLLPAQTWPHKNHRAAIEALALLRRREGIDAHLVCTGGKNDFYPRVQARVDELGLGDVVHFLGYVDASALRVLYSRCNAVVFPSLFEGWGIPIVEGFSESKPVLSSNASCLPEVAAGAAALFDPHDHEGLSRLMGRVLSDDPFAAQLAAKGAARAKDFSWERTARTFRALYREALGHEPSPEDADYIAMSRRGP